MNRKYKELGLINLKSGEIFYSVFHSLHNAIFFHLKDNDLKKHKENDHQYLKFDEMDEDEEYEVNEYIR